MTKALFSLFLSVVILNKLTLVGHFCVFMISFCCSTDSSTNVSFFRVQVVIELHFVWNKYKINANVPLQSVLEGYNGTVMAYGQTGTGKTYTVGRLGKDDPSERGIMVRALEHILSSMSFETDRVAISYLQVLFPTTINSVM